MGSLQPIYIESIGRGLGPYFVLLSRVKKRTGKSACAAKAAGRAVPGSSQQDALRVLEHAGATKGMFRLLPENLRHRALETWELRGLM